MPATKPKHLTYRRAVWFATDQIGNNLARLLADLFKVKPEIADTRYDAAPKKIDVRKHLELGNVVHLHMCAYTEREHASTVKKDHVAGKEDLGTAPPPLDADYLDNDAYVRIENSDVFICSNGMHETTVGFYLGYLVGLINTAAANFSVERVPVKDKLDQLLSEGVKSIELNVTAFDVEIDELNEAAENPVQKALRTVRALVEKDRSRDEVEDYARIQSSITYTFDGRIAGAATEQILTGMAYDVWNEVDSGFVIKTKTGTEITASDISVRKLYQIKRDGKSLKRDDAWAALDDFAHGLKASGVCPTLT